jgi:hypothetical protein
MAEPTNAPNDDEELDIEQQDEATGKQPDDSNANQNQEGEEEEISNDPVEDDGDEEEEPPVSPRESKRIQALLDKMAANDQSRSQNRAEAPKRDGKQVIPEGEYDIEQVNEMANKFGTDMYQQGLSEAQQYSIANTFATRLEIDAPRVNSKYNFLDQDSEEFNPGIAGFVNRVYLNTVGYDPNTGVVQNMDLRYGEFVEGLMDVINLVSAGKVADTSKKVAQQAAQTGIRPGGSRKVTYKGDDPSQMTDEQLEQAIKNGLRI